MPMKEGKVESKSKDNDTVTSSMSHRTSLRLRSVDDCARVLRARHLRGCSDGETDAVAAEEGCRGTRIDAKIEVDVRTDRIRISESAL